MGYLTRFEIDYDGFDPSSDLFASIVERLTAAKIVPWVFDEHLNSRGEVKWYTEEEDMLQLSREFPDILFTTHGEGEENDDIWNHYYLGGKIQKCEAQIFIPPFDPSKLEDR